MSKRVTLLYIDDDADDIMIFQDALEGLEPFLNIVTLKSPSAPLDFLSAMSPPEFVFLNINMPGLSGRDLLRIIRKDNRWQHVPVIMYTTSIHESEKEAFREDGANDFMQKGTSLRDIRRDVLGILAQFHVTINA